MIYTNTDLAQIIKEIPVNSVLGQTQEAIEGFFFQKNTFVHGATYVKRSFVTLGDG